MQLSVGLFRLLFVLLVDGCLVVGLSSTAAARRAVVDGGPDLDELFSGHKELEG